MEDTLLSCFQNQTSGRYRTNHDAVSLASGFGNPSQGESLEPIEVADWAVSQPVAAASARSMGVEPVAVPLLVAVVIVRPKVVEPGAVAGTVLELN